MVFWSLGIPIPILAGSWLLLDRKSGKVTSLGNSKKEIRAFPSKRAIAFSGFGEGKEMDLYEAINRRRSVRIYKDEKVPKAKIKKVLEAAIMAPSILNSQPWRFDVVKGRTRQKLVKIINRCTLYLEDILKGDKHHEKLAKVFFADLGRAPVLIVVSLPLTQNWFDHFNYLLSVGGAIQNLQLAAHSEELATCCVASPTWIRDEMVNLLKLKNREIATVLTLGVPEVMPKAPSRTKEVIHWID